MIEGSRPVPNPLAPMFALATRVAGAVLALGYLGGIVRGPLVSVIAALALITLGRALLMNRDDAFFVCASLALFGAALLVGALRWGSLELGEIRGAQSVLGPTLLIGPTAAAAASSAAAVAAALALVTWLAPSAAGGDEARLWWLAEAVLGGVALVSIFWGPEIVEGIGGSLIDPGAWGLTLLVTAIVLLPLSRVVSRRARGWRVGTLVLAAGAVVGAGIATLAL